MTRTSHHRWRIEALLARHGLTWDDARRIMGLSRRTLQNRLWCRRPWQPGELELLADRLGCPVGYLRGLLDEDDLYRIAKQAGNPEIAERWVVPPLTGWDIVRLYVDWKCIKKPLPPWRWPNSPWLPGRPLPESLRPSLAARDPE